MVGVSMRRQVDGISGAFDMRFECNLAAAQTLVAPR
jgi:hypothetical protein